MAKTLTLDVTSFKFADNDTDLSFTALKNGVIVSDSTLSATIKIKQVDVGYLKSVSAKWVDKHIVISSGDLSDLPVGSYLVELWLSSSSGYEIYPDSGFVKLYINQNATGISGNLISSITLGEFQQQFSDLSAEILNNLPDGKVGPQGEKGDTGPQGVQGIQGERGEQGEQGQQGVQGVAGKDFSIAETFPSVASMNGNGLTKGDFVMISSTVEDPDNAKLYLWNGTGFTFVTDMSGATGIKGDTGAQGVQGEQGIQGPKGDQGIQGPMGPTGPQGIQGPQGDKGDKGDKGDGVVDTTADYTWTGTNTFNNKIIAPAGVQGNADSATKLQTPRKINGADFDGTTDITINQAVQVISTATDLFTLSNGFYYSGWFVAPNKPATASNYFIVEVLQTDTNGFMRLIDDRGLSFLTTKRAGAWGTWKQYADNSTVVHNTGTETIAGDKNFTGNNNFIGQTTLKTGNYGLRVTTSGVQKTSDGGTTWVNI